MKRTVPVIAIILIGVILVSDIGLIAKFHQKPDAYALLENVSFLHFILLSEWGIQFAYAKASFSLVLILFWFFKAIYPTEVKTLVYITVAYALIWSMIGLLVLTGIVGTLQYSAGLKIRLYDFTPLVASMGLANLIKLTFFALCLPLVLMALPALYNLKAVDSKLRSGASMSRSCVGRWL